MKPISKYYKNAAPVKFQNIDNALFQDILSSNFITELMDKLPEHSIYYRYSNHKSDKTIFSNHYANSKDIFLKFYFLKDSIAKTKTLISTLKQGFKNLGLEISNVGGKAHNIGSYLTIYYYKESNKLVITFGGLYLNLYSFLIAEGKTNFTFSIKDENSIKMKRYNSWTSLTMNTFFSFIQNERIGNISHTLSKEFLLKFFKMNNNNEYFTKEFNFDIIDKGIYLPKISLKEFRTISNKKSLLKRIFNVESLPKQFLKFDICEIYFFYKNLKLVDINDWAKVISFYNNLESKKELYIYESELSSLKLEYDFELLKQYYHYTFIQNNESYLKANSKNENILIKDYLNLCKLLSINVNLRMTSFKKLKQEHDRLALELIERDIEKRDIRIKEEYKKLDFISLIKTTEDLVLESKRQHHCVASYLQSIENGFCAIYTDLYSSKRYTIEISYSSTKQIYILNQCKGVFNSEPPVEYLKILREKLKLVNKEIADKNVSEHKTDKIQKNMNMNSISQSGVRIA